MVSVEQCRINIKAKPLRWYGIVLFLDIPISNHDHHHHYFRLQQLYKYIQSKKILSFTFPFRFLPSSMGFNTPERRSAAVPSSRRRGEWRRPCSSLYPLSWRSVRNKRTERRKRFKQNWNRSGFWRTRRRRRRRRRRTAAATKWKRSGETGEYGRRRSWWGINVSPWISRA